MSRAFVKEDAPSEDVFVPTRAPLPPDSPNLVTPKGLALLEAELTELQTHRAALKEVEGERERARQQAIADGQIAELQQRLASAEVTPPLEPDSLTVAFGSRVTVRVLNGKFAGEERTFGIVGVDEAGDDETLVAFTAPIARALLGCRLGDRAELTVASTEQVLEVIDLGRYDV
ncbi:GreA/GreB family elongation factor [soil metagenome]